MMKRWLTLLAVCGLAHAGILGHPSLSNGTAGVPVAAAQVGFNTLTWNSTTIGTTTGTLQAMTLESCVTAAQAYTQRGNGSIYLSGYGNSCSGANLSTAVQASGSTPNWKGVAFGGGAYFEMTASFTGQGTGPYANGGPAFWAEDIEHMSQDRGYSVTWPTSGCTAWNSSAAYVAGNCATTGGSSYFAIVSNTNQQPPNATYWLISSSYNDFFEVDFMQYDCTHTYCYQNGIGQWYGRPGRGVLSTSNPYQAYHNCAGCVNVPTGTDFTQPHKYATLWVPQSQGCAPYAPGQGCLIFFFDGVQTGATFVWNAYSASNLPPPVNNSTAMSGMDNRHLAILIGTGTDQPMTVYSVKVWQASSANNLRY
jgi:hypothetical protein